uniref:Uncharacterized protein n=1 Tax=Gouania willdenowi TaxID=441366 RepID=A0A8C5ET25_GOUWI
LHVFCQGWRDEDELKCPQADVGNWEDLVIAHIGATRLGGVADKVFAFVAPHPLGRHHEHHHAKDEDHGEPDSSEYIHSWWLGVGEEDEDQSQNDPAGLEFKPKKGLQKDILNMIVKIT